MRLKFTSTPPRKTNFETLQFSNNSLRLKLKKLELFYMFNNLCKRKTLLNRHLTLLPLQKKLSIQKYYDIF